MPEKMTSPPETEKDLDKEPEEEFEDFVEFEREHRDDDERSYGEITDEDFNQDAVEEDSEEYEEG